MPLHLSNNIKRTVLSSCVKYIFFNISHYYQIYHLLMFSNNLKPLDETTPLNAFLLNAGYKTLQRCIVITMLCVQENHFDPWKTLHIGSEIGVSGFVLISRIQINMHLAGLLDTNNMIPDFLSRRCHVSSNILLLACTNKGSLCYHEISLNSSKWNLVTFKT